MADCIFCGVAAGTVRAHVVHETADAVAFLDRHPAARGHALVIPRVHASSLLEVPDAAVGGLFLSVKEVVRRIDAALRPVAFHVGWNHGEAAGQHVFHLHVHVLPRFHHGRGIQMLGEGAGRVDLEEIAVRIRGA